MASVQETVRRLTIESTAKGVGETADKLKQLGAAHAGVTVESRKTERATLSMEKRLESIQRRYDANYRKEQEIAKVTRDLNAARAQGLITLQRQNELLAMQAAGFDRSAAGARGFATVMNGVRTIAGGLGVSFGLVGLMRLPGMVKEIVDEAGSLVDTADKIGLSTTALQQLGFAGQQTGVEFAELGNGLSFFSRQVGEASRGQGDLYEILKLNDTALRDTSGNLRPLNDLMGDYADLVMNAGTAQERAALVTKAFGRSGDALINTLSQGKVGLNQFGTVAERTGQLIEDGLLRRAEEAGDRWDAALGHMKTSWNTFWLEIATSFAPPSLMDAHNWLVETTGLGERWVNDQRQTAAEAEEAMKEDMRRQAAARAAGGAADGIGTVRTGFDFAGRFDPSFRPTRLPQTATPETDKWEAALAAAKQQTEALQMQAQTFGMSAGAVARYTREQELLNLAEANKIKRTPEVLASIAGQSDAYGRATDRLVRMQEAAQGAQVFGDTLFDALDRIVGKSEDAGAVVLDLIAKLLQAEAQAQFMNAIGAGRDAPGPLGLLGSFLGGLGGGAATGMLYHRGGIVGAPGGPSRNVHAAYFDDAPRYHAGGIAGLAADEVPAILRRGEPVFRDMDHARRAVGGGRSQIEVIVSVDDDGKLGVIARQAGRDGGADAADVRVSTFSRHELPDRLREIDRHPRRRG